MPIDKPINLDLPVDAYDADGNPRKKDTENITDDNSTVVSQTEEKVEEKKVDEEEEQRVPYSRFATVREAKERAEREADEARALLREALVQRREPEVTTAASSYDDEYARDVKRLYGDTPVADEIISINTRQMRAIEERAERRAVEAVSRLRDYETQALTQNESILDRRLETLETSLGRTLNDREQSELLSIVDEYTPTGPDGKYVGEILPFDKAWEVFELRHQAQTMNTQRNRSAALNASSTRSHGEPTGSSQEADKNWSPLNWKSLNDRLEKINH